MRTPPSKQLTVGAVTIEAAKIRRVNTFAVFAQGFLCIPGTGSVQPSTADINAAIAGITVTWAPHQRFHAVEVSQGFAVFVFPVDAPSHAIRIATSIAEAIQPLGFKGIITACSDKLGPCPRTRRRFAYNAALCSSDAAIDRDRAPLAFREVKDNQTCWAVESPAFRTLVARLADWAADNTTGRILAGLHATMSSSEPRQVAAVLTQCCADVGKADLLFPTNHGDWYVNFTWEGWVIVGTEYKDGAPEGINALTKLLHDLAPLYDYAAVTLRDFGGVTPRVVMFQAHVPGPEDREFAADHSFVKALVPGIFAFQVLGPGHGDLKPVDAWNSFPLADGKRMVISRTPTAWWGRPEGFPQTGFDDLREANKDLLGKWAGPVVAPDTDQS